MKCKNTSGKCDYQEKLKPIEGKGSFQGFDVFQCPKCKEVATTVKKSVIKKGLPEGISPSSNPRTKAQMISENNSDEFRDYAKRENITPKELCPNCGIEATEGNEVTGFKCPNCDQQPSHHPSNFAHEDLGDNTGLPSRINKFTQKGAPKPQQYEEDDYGGGLGDGRQEDTEALDMGDAPSYQKSLAKQINKFVSKSEEKVFGDMGEQKPFMVEGEPDKINYYGRKIKLDKSIKKAIDTPLYSIKKDNPDPDIKKWRPSKGAGAAIGGGTGAIIAGPLGAAGGAYLGHKLGKDKVKKAVPGWESTSQNPCPTCGQEMPDNGMECAAHSNVIGLASRINNFVDKGRDFQTKGERREQNKRPRMPMSGRNTGEVYRNAVAKRAPKPSKKMGNINKAGAPILPCKSCGKPVPHFKSSPPTTQGLCSECIRTSLTKPKMENKIMQKDFKPYPNQPSVKSNMWNRQKACINPQCGWTQGYTKDNPRHALVEQSGNCPQCGKVTRDIPFSPDF